MSVYSITLIPRELNKMKVKFMFLLWLVIFVAKMDKFTHLTNECLCSLQVASTNVALAILGQRLICSLSLNR